jgi:hypothetical protein
VFIMQLHQSIVPSSLQLQHIQRGLKGTDMNAKKVSCLALVVVVRSCSECVHTEYFVPFLQCICKGITDPAVFPHGQSFKHCR